MGDSGFNAHELLSRLRSGPSNGNKTNQTESHSPTRSDNSLTRKTASVSSPRQPAKSLQAQPTEAPSQRRENVEIRIELELEIKRLQEEVQKLKAENKQLLMDKVAAEQQMHSIKQKSDDVIAKLRCKIAGKGHKKTEAVLPGGAIETHGPRIGPGKHVQPSSRGTSFPYNVPPPPPPSSNDPLSAGANFSGPTFSELMRRNTPETPDFATALRRPHMGNGLTNGVANKSKTPGSAHPSPQQLQQQPLPPQPYSQHGGYQQPLQQPSQQQQFVGNSGYPYMTPHSLQSAGYGYGSQQQPQLQQQPRIDGHFATPGVGHAVGGSGSRSRQAPPQQPHSNPAYMQDAHPNHQQQSQLHAGDMHHLVQAYGDTSIGSPSPLDRRGMGGQGSGSGGGSGSGSGGLDGYGGHNHGSAVYNGYYGNFDSREEKDDEEELPIVEIDLRH